MIYDEKRELAWKCWEDILKTLHKIEYYTLPDCSSEIRKGCGGDVVNIIMKYI